MSGKRKVFSYQLKRQIIEEMSNGAKNIEICKKFGIPSSTVSTLWRDRQRIMEELEDVSPFCKRARKSKKNDLDSALMAWIKTEGQTINLNGTVLKGEAERIATELGHINFNCSKGWLHRFRTRHNIVFGKSKNANRVEQESEWLKTTWIEVMRRAYKDEDVYAAHEVGLFYDTTPEIISDELMEEKCLDGQLDDKRLTVLLCCNMNGTDKRPLAVVGSTRILSFSNYFEGMLMTYSYNAQSWMTREVFEKEMFVWDEELRQANRSILVLVNSCSAHVRLTALENIRLCFLPKNAPGLQPIDRGISQNFRKLYRRQLVISILDDLVAGCSRRITVMEAFSLIHHVWGLIDCDFIKTAFANAGLLDASKSSASQTSEPPHIQLSEWLDVQKKGLLFDNLDIYEFFDEGLTTCIPDAGLITCLPDVPAAPAEGIVVKEEEQMPEKMQLELDQGPMTTVDDAKEALKILNCFFEERSKKAETLLALDVLNRNIDDVTRASRADSYLVVL